MLDRDRCSLASPSRSSCLDRLGAGLVGILVPLWFFIAACGFTFPLVQVLGLAAHGNEAGTAASLLGALNFGIAGLISPIVGGSASDGHPDGDGDGVDRRRRDPDALVRRPPPDGPRAHALTTRTAARSGP